MINYTQLLTDSASKVKNCACMGLDVKWEVLPNRSGDIYSDIISFYDELFSALQEAGFNNAQELCKEMNVTHHGNFENGKRERRANPFAC